jgi:hemerythrin
MSAPEWRDSYRTHIPEIDADHQRLFALAASLDRAVLDGRGEQAVRPALLELVEYTRTHFETEERLMAAARYPGLEAHRQEHAAFLAGLRRRLELPASVIAKDVSLMLGNWLVDHVVRTDRDYVPYLLRRHGLSTPLQAATRMR